MTGNNEIFGKPLKDIEKNKNAVKIVLNFGERGRTWHFDSDD